MGITVKEQHRLGSRVNVSVLENGITTYARYVDAADWDADPEAIAAELADYLRGLATAASTTPTFPTAPLNKNAVTLSDAQIATKLAALTAAKLAAEKVKP